MVELNITGTSPACINLDRTTGTLKVTVDIPPEDLETVARLLEGMRSSPSSVTVSIRGVA